MPISFWVKGVPRSLAAQKKEAYTALIQEAARCVRETCSVASHRRRDHFRG
jgi:hypothetical protein